jgi:DNA-binding NarL/FixJ family response regulator
MRTTPKVVIIDDFPNWRDTIRRHLEENGMKVIATASTLRDGLKVIESFEKLGVDVVVLDGHLDQSREDGNLLGRQCKRQAPDVLRVGMSRYIDGVTEVDIVVGKDNLSDLAETIFAVLDQQHRKN